MSISIGDIYWLKIKSDIKHPHVIVGINNDDSVLVCSITTNTKKFNMPKTIVLEAGEGNLQRQSIVEAYKIYTVQTKELSEYIGTLENSSIRKINSVWRL